MNTESILLDRRDFLRGATLLGVAATLGFETEAQAATTSLTTLAFWSQSQFLNPATLSGSDATLNGQSARVMIHGHFVPKTVTTPLLHVLKAHFAVTVNGKVTDIPVYAWVATKQKGKDSSLHVPVGPVSGLLFSLELNSTPKTEESYFLAAGQTQGKAKLQSGTYAIAAGNPSWVGCRLTQTNGVSVIVRDTVTGTVPANFEYVLITIGRG